MKRPHPEDPTRWRRTPPDSPSSSPLSARSAIEAEIGSAIDRIPEPEPFDDLRLEQIRQRVLRRARPAAAATAGTARRLWVRTCALAVACFVLGGLAVAAMQRIAARRPPARAPAATDAPAAPAQRPARRSVAVAETPAIDLLGTAAPPSTSAATAAEEATAAPVPHHKIAAPPAASPRASRSPLARPSATEDETPAPGVAPTAALSFRPAPPAVAAVTASPGPPPPSPSPPPATAAATGDHGAATAEAAYIARALRSLRTDHDPRAALAELDRRDQLFPRGLLGRETALARVEALVALGRNGAALAILDPMALSGAATDRRVSVLRAELRAAEQRCAEALADFDRTLRTATNDDVTARALYGRALCRARGGDTPGARDDLGSYLRRFPAGPDRAAAARELDRLTTND